MLPYIVRSLSRKCIGREFLAANRLSALALACVLT